MKISGKVRRPREDEIRLMKLLASGRHALDSGPVGRCSSRGWIRYAELDERGSGIYELAPLGRAWLDEDEHSSGAQASEETTKIVFERGGRISRR
jgi:hypothetical protein